MKLDWNKTDVFMESLASAFESISTFLIQKDGKCSLKCVWAVSKKGDPEGNEEALVTVTVPDSTQTLGCARCSCNQWERSSRGTGRTRAGNGETLCTSLCSSTTKGLQYTDRSR